ncbi:MAG TPA: PGPGW domain-containing protein [Planctomycetaceae bacterium]|nr:PGPGW domain-containing protein [Planctomycetaceae bacterium]
MLERIGLTEAHVGWIVAISIAMFVAGIVALPWMLARIPRDYFLTHSAPLARWKETRPVARLVVLALRNLIGAVFAILGIIMLFAPGQGVLMLLVGLSMMTFPGKRALELRLIRMKRVLKTINWLRRKSGHEPLELPERESRERTPDAST